MADILWLRIDTLNLEIQYGRSNIEDQIVKIYLIGLAILSED